MKRVLACLDDSAAATFVFVQARDFAERYNAELSLLHVVVPNHGLTLPHETAADDKQQQKTADIKKELIELLDQVPIARRGKTLVGEGEPWRVVCWYARDMMADMIMIGAHGTPQRVSNRKHPTREVFDRVLGTTAQLVVQKADRTVIVVREHPRS